MKRIISFYLMKEVTGPFIIGISIFTFIFLMNSILRLTELVVNKGVKIVDISKLILYAMPSFLIFTIPMAFLMAVLTALGRLSGDNEITAMKGSGISLYQLVTPIMALSFMCFVLTAFISIYSLPKGNYSYNNLIYNMVKSKANIGIQERTFNSDFEGLVLYVNEIPVRGKKLRGILVSERRGTGEPHTIFAKEGYVLSDPESMIITLRLIDGDIHRAGKDLDTYQRIGFSTYDINLDLGMIIKERVSSSRKYKEMSLAELREKAKILRENNMNPYHPLRIFHERFSFPFACLVFGLLAVPLGIQSRPSGKFWGFVLSLGVIVVYYVFLTGGEVLAKNGKMPIHIALWMPNLFFGVLGVYMLYKTANESPVNAITWMNNILKKTGKKNAGEVAE